MGKAWRDGVGQHPDLCPLFPCRGSAGEGAWSGCGHRVPVAPSGQGETRPRRGEQQQQSPHLSLFTWR